MVFVHVKLHTGEFVRLIYTFWMSDDCWKHCVACGYQISPLLAAVLRRVEDSNSKVFFHQIQFNLIKSNALRISTDHSRIQRVLALFLVIIIKPEEADVRIVIRVIFSSEESINNGLHAGCKSQGLICLWHVSFGEQNYHLTIKTYY